MPQLFRVVGTRNDKSRATLITRLPEDRARATMLALIDTGAFISVEIEPEGPHRQTTLRLVDRGLSDEWDG